MSENEKLPALARRACQQTIEVFEGDQHAKEAAEYMREVLLNSAALSQQVEPVEPAPARGEREDWSGALLQVAVVLEALRSSDSAARLANMDAGKVLGEAYAKLKRIRATRPAQTEQQPEQEPFWYAVVSEQAPTINSAIKRLDVAQEFADSKRERWPDTRVVPLYAAPIAQTAPQCNHRFMHFGDQKKRRCADCCVVEGNEQTAPQPEQSGLVGHVCGGDGTHNTVNVCLADPAPWDALRIGTPVMLVALTAQGGSADE